MNVWDLLLTEKEQRAAKRACDQSIWGARDAALCRAQAAKVLAVLGGIALTLGHHEGTEYVSAALLESIGRETGLTWPPKTDLERNV